MGLVQKSKSIGKLLVKVGKSHTVFSQEAKVTNSILTHNCNYTHRPNISTGQNKYKYIHVYPLTKYIQEYLLAKYWETIGEGGEATQSYLAKGLARTKGNESCGCSMTVFIELLKMVRAERGSPERGEVFETYEREYEQLEPEESRRPFDNNISGAGPDFDGNCSSIRRTGHWPTACLA